VKHVETLSRPPSSSSPGGPPSRPGLTLAGAGRGGDAAGLVIRAQGGDEDAFCRLIEPHWGSLVRLARSVVGDKDAEDAAQEGLLASWSRLSGLREPGAFSAWLHRIVLRHCLRQCRRRRRLWPWGSLDATPELEPAAPAGDPSGVDYRQGSAWVEHLLRRLPPRQRVVMHLTVVEERTDREIAEVMDITAASVRSHRRRARETLRRRLEGSVEGDVE
jgi:RNA polymerase sigma-70 factor, ECF subfamily